MKVREKRLEKSVKDVFEVRRRDHTGGTRTVDQLAGVAEEFIKVRA